MAELTGKSAKGEATRRRIFEAATREFAEKGYAGSRIDRIARDAGINKQRIYAYFRDKENLFVQVWRRTYELIFEEDQEFLDLDDHDIPRLGEIILRRYMAFHEAHPEFWRIFVAENLVGDGHGRPGPPSNEKPFGHLRDLYRRGQRRGIHDPDLSFEAFIFVIVAVTFFYTSNMKTMSDTLGTDLADPEEKNRMIKEIGKMIFSTKDPR